MPRDSVLTDAAVTDIKQGKKKVVLTTSRGLVFQAKKAILAIMPSTYDKISFSPSLPDDKRGLISASQEGQYGKVLLSYATPWWRSANLTGQFFSFTGPITYSLETSVPELEQYSLACFVAGDFADNWFNLTDSEKKKAVVDHLVAMSPEGFADAVRDTLEINYTEWTKETYIGGGPTNAMGPGMLRQYGETLRMPVGMLHFAGTETAYKWKGYLEGAVDAGYRAAGEVMETLAHHN
jgi:monoamine oxidase